MVAATVLRIRNSIGHPSHAPDWQFVQGVRLRHRHEQGATPFDTIVDEPVTYRSGNQDYSPHNYDDRFERPITLRRALADSRNVPAIRLAEKSGIQSVIDTARRFGISSPLPPYLQLPSAPPISPSWSTPPRLPCFPAKEFTSSQP